MDLGDLEHGPGFGPEWYLSRYNEPDLEGAVNLTAALIHDTTLRDGEQHVGVAFSRDEKVEVGLKLAEIGVQRIEVCMPAAGEADQQATAALVRARTASEIWALARSVVADVELSASLGVAGVTIGCLANSQYLRAFRWRLEQVIEMSGNAILRANQLGLKSTLCIADTSRMAPDHLLKLVEGVEAIAQPDSYAIMDTFGALSPEGTSALVTHMRTLTSSTIEFHGHNDFGLSVVNSIAAARAGATAIHTAVHGLGERIGNTPLEEYVVAANALYGAGIPVDTTGLMELSRIVARTSGLHPASNKPIVGAFNLIESGSVGSEYLRLVEGMGLPAQWMMPFTPAYVGQDPVEVVVGKVSGAANVRHVLKDGPYADLSDAEVRGVLALAQERAVETKRIVAPEELHRLADKVRGGVAAVVSSTGDA